MLAEIVVLLVVRMKWVAAAFGGRDRRGSKD